MLLLRWTPVADGRRRHPDELGYDYRIADRAGLEGLAARRRAATTTPQLEVVQHRLRVADRAAPGEPRAARAGRPAVEPAAIGRVRSARARREEPLRAASRVRAPVRRPRRSPPGRRAVELAAPRRADG